MRTKTSICQLICGATRTNSVVFLSLVIWELNRPLLFNLYFVFRMHEGWNRTEQMQQLWVFLIYFIRMPKNDFSWNSRQRKRIRIRMFPQFNILHMRNLIIPLFAKLNKGPILSIEVNTICSTSSYESLNQKSQSISNAVQSFVLATESNYPTPTTSTRSIRCLPYGKSIHTWLHSLQSCINFNLSFSSIFRSSRIRMAQGIPSIVYIISHSHYYYLLFSIKI